MRNDKSRGLFFILRALQLILRATCILRAICIPRAFSRLDQPAAARLGTSSPTQDGHDAVVISDAAASATTSCLLQRESCLAQSKSPSCRKSGLSGGLEASFLSSSGEVIEAPFDASDVISAPPLDLLRLSASACARPLWVHDALQWLKGWLLGWKWCWK